MIIRNRTTKILGIQSGCLFMFFNIFVKNNPQTFAENNQNDYLCAVFVNSIRYEVI